MIFINYANQYLYQLSEVSVIITTVLNGETEASVDE